MKKRYKKLIAMAVTLLGGVLLGGEAYAADTYVALEIGDPAGVGANGTAGSVAGLIKGQILTPEDEGTAVAKHYYVPVTVRLTKAGDYYVGVKAEDSANLVGKNNGQVILDSSNRPVVIPTVSGSSTLAQLEDAWGFRYKTVTAEELAAVSEDTFIDGVTELAFVGMPDNADEAVTVLEGKNGGNDTKYVLLDFGAGVTGKMPSGRYGTNVLVTAVAKPSAVANLTNFYDITTMQEMTAGVCNTVLTPKAGATTVADAEAYAAALTDEAKRNLVPEVVLTDTRDGKKYVVRKMPDGNCWMAQNLDLDLHVNNCYDNTGAQNGDMGTCRNGRFVPLTSANTDIAPASDGAVRTWAVLGENKAYNTQKPDEIGADYKWNAYGTTGEAGTENTTDFYEIRSYDPGDKCWTAGAYNGTDASAECASPTTTADAKHAGNYYNWPAATAGTGTYSTNTNYTNVTGSICPRGWDLPTGSQSASAGGQINTLLNTIPEIIAVGNKNATSMTATIFSKMTSNPYSLVRSGVYRYGTGVLDNTGMSGYLWTSTAYDASYAYFLRFYSGDVYPGTDYFNKSFGFPPTLCGTTDVPGFYGG